MAQNELDIIVRLKSQIAKDLQPVRQSLKGLAEDIELGKRPVAVMRDLFTGLRQTVFSTTGILIGAAGAVAGITYFVKQSIPTVQEYGLAIGGLESILVKLGYQASEATGALRRLSEDGLIQPTTAATGLRNLLMGGLGLPEAIELMEAFADIGAYADSSTLSLDEKVRNLSMSFVTGYSQMAKNAGMAITWGEAMEIGATKTGKNADELNKAEQALAKYTGALIYAKGFQGDSDRLASSFTGTMMKLNNAMYMLKVTVGALVIPALDALAKIITTVALATGSLIQRIAPGWIQMGLDMVKGSIMGGSSIEELMNQFNQLGGTVSKVADRIRDEMRSFARETKKAIQSFRRQLADLVFSHKDKVLQLKKQLEEEKKNLEERIEKMKEPYEDMKKAAIQAGKERLADLKAQLDKELAKGKNTNWEKVRMLEEFIAEEKIAINKSIAEWDAKAQEEIAIENAKGQERISAIEKELQEEEAILARHAGAIASVKDLQREDDIQRLIREHEEDMKLRDTMHQETLQKIREQGSEGGGAYGSSFWDAWKEYATQAKEKIAEGIQNAFAGIKDIKIDWGAVLTAIFQGMATTFVMAKWVVPIMAKLLTSIAASLGVGLVGAIAAILGGLSLGAIVIRWVWNNRGRIIEAGRNVVRYIKSGIMGLIGQAWGWGVIMMAKIVAGFKAAVRGIGSGIKSLVNKIVDWLNSALRKAPAPFRWFQIPRLARGIEDFRGGLAVVGERGPELVNLPRGSDVIPSEKSRLATVNNYNTFNIQTPFDIDLAMERVAMKARTTLR